MTASTDTTETTKELIGRLVRSGRYRSQRAIAIDASRHLGYQITQQAVSFHLQSIGARRDQWRVWYIPGGGKWGSSPSQIPKM